MTALSLAVTAIAVTAALSASFLTWQGALATGQNLLGALWLLPPLIALHLFQLFLAAVSWRSPMPAQSPPLAAFYRLRIVREGIDSLLPVAQVGGEIIGARLLAQRGTSGSLASASIVVDVTIEVLTHLVFLICGLMMVALLSPAANIMTWVILAACGALSATCLVLAQRFGALRLIEWFMRRLAARWPVITALTSLDGLHAAAGELYRRRRPMLVALGLHQVAWFLGSIESWAVLNAVGVSVSPARAFAVESLGMAARSAGFAIPGALGVQEGGFMLAAIAVGLPAAPALALSLIKRLREISVGVIGLALWRLGARS